jgi:hypothetical protein
MVWNIIFLYKISEVIPGSINQIVWNMELTYRMRGLQSARYLSFVFDFFLSISLACLSIPEVEYKSSGPPSYFCFVIGFVGQYNYCVAFFVPPIDFVLPSIHIICC